MSDPLHFKLKSGRVLLLKWPLTPEERAECESEEGMRLLEILADTIAARCTFSIQEDSPRGKAILKQHRIET